MYKKYNYKHFFRDIMLAIQGLMCYHNGGKLGCSAVAPCGEL